MQPTPHGAENVKLARRLDHIEPFYVMERAKAAVDHVAPIEKLAQNLYICPSAVAQHAALACFEPASIKEYERRRSEFRARRDFIVPALRELGFVIPVDPDGAFYVYLDCSAFDSDSSRLAADMLDQAGELYSQNS